MIEGYLTIKEVAEKWCVTRRRVQTLCSQGKIDGVTRFGNVWAIPVDKRVNTGKYKGWRKKRRKMSRVTECDLLR